MDKKQYESYKIYKKVKEDSKRFRAYANNTYKCECGHSIVIPKTLEKRICSHCGKYVFKNKKDEFIFRTKEKLKKWC